MNGTVAPEVIVVSLEVSVRSSFSGRFREADNPVARQRVRVLYADALSFLFRDHPIPGFKRVHGRRQHYREKVSKINWHGKDDAEFLTRGLISDWRNTSCVLSDDFAARNQYLFGFLRAAAEAGRLGLIEWNDRL